MPRRWRSPPPSSIAAVRLPARSLFGSPPPPAHPRALPSLFGRYALSLARKRRHAPLLSLEQPWSVGRKGGGKGGKAFKGFKGGRLGGRAKGPGPSKPFGRGATLRRGKWGMDVEPARRGRGGGRGRGGRGRKLANPRPPWWADAS